MFVDRNGCNGCPYAPRSWAEYYLGCEEELGICHDAYSEEAKECYYYLNTYEDLNPSDEIYSGKEKYEG